MIDERRTGAGGVLWLPAGTIAVIACCVGKRRLASIRVTALDAVTDPALYAGERGFFLNNGSVKVSATRSAALRHLYVAQEPEHGRSLRQSASSASTPPHTPRWTPTLIPCSRPSEGGVFFGQRLAAQGSEVGSAGVS